jgi:hypothetical protein
MEGPGSAAHCAVNEFCGVADIPARAYCGQGAVMGKSPMKNNRQIPDTRAIWVSALMAGSLIASAALAQNTPTQSYPTQTQSYPSQTPAYPTQTPGYPDQTQAYSAYPAPAPAAAAPHSHPIRDLFAGTIATVLQSATGGLSSALTGSIMNWFAKRQSHSAAAGYAATAYPGTAYSAIASPSQGAQDYAPSAYPSGGTAAQYPGTATQYPGTATQYPGTSYSQPDNQASGNAYDGTSGTAYGGVQIYDARTGQLSTGGANPYATPAGSNGSTLYAGIAYEVHALAADGSSTPINPATYVFRTGDKFLVYYRPSLPGRMEVYNINPAGQHTLIDSSNMAAGQMTTLGPYQFTNQVGDESLRLVLSPCSSPQLLATTRDIVRADLNYQATPQASPTSNSGVQLSACGATSTRGLDVRTRDIQKVAVDGMTSYALDPVSQHELSAGQVTPREANIVLHHR